MGVTFVIVLQFVIVAVVFTAVTADGIKFRECKGKKFTGSVKSVKVNNDTDIAILKKGSTAHLEVDFSAGVKTTKSKSVCHGMIAGVPVPFPVTEDGCSEMDPPCPLIPKNNYVFKTSIEVKKIYPSMKLIIEWEEVDVETGTDIFCILIPAQIVE